MWHEGPALVPKAAFFAPYALFQRVCGALSHKCGEDGPDARALPSALPSTPWGTSARVADVHRVVGEGRDGRLIPLAYPSSHSLGLAAHHISSRWANTVPRHQTMPSGGKERRPAYLRSPVYCGMLRAFADLSDPNLQNPHRCATPHAHSVTWPSDSSVRDLRYGDRMSAWCFFSSLLRETMLYHNAAIDISMNTRPRGHPSGPFGKSNAYGTHG